MAVHRFAPYAYEPLSLPNVMCQMLRDGKYAAWFRTSRGEGTGIVYLANGKVAGADSIFSYSGTYQLDGDRFTATLMTQRYAAGPTTLFGIDEVEVKLSGAFKGTMASCSGTSEQAPDMRFEATLLLSQEHQPPRPELPRPLPNFGAAKLPQAPSSRYRARNLQISGPSR